MHEAVQVDDYKNMLLLTTTRAPNLLDLFFNYQVYDRLLSGCLVIHRVKG